MRVLTYRVVFERPAEDPGRVWAAVPAFPEVLASGQDESSALVEAGHGLDAALRFCIAEGIDIPDSDVAVSGDAVVAASPETAAKVFVIEAFRRSNLSKSEIARRTGLAENEIRRVLDPRHASKIGRMAEVGHELGSRITVAEVA